MIECLIDNVKLDNKTVLVNDSIRSVLDRLAKVGRKGVDIRLFTVSGENECMNECMQTVVTFLSSRYNPAPCDRRSKVEVENLISDALDKVLISDRVRSASDFYKTNFKKDMDSSNTLVVES